MTKPRVVIRVYASEAALASLSDSQPIAAKAAGAPDGHVADRVSALKPSSLHPFTRAPDAMLRLEILEAPCVAVQDGVLSHTL